MGHLKPADLSEGEKARVIQGLYAIVQQEITRYRDYEWKITSWTIAIIGGIVAATQAIAFEDAHRGVVKTLLVVLTVVVAGYGIWHLCFVHSKLTENKMIRRELDGVLKFFEMNVYAECSLLPDRWNRQPIRFWQAKVHLLSWWGLIVVAAVYAMYAIWLKK